jgi:hypothetical protein
MQTDTEAGEMIRYYFIQLRKFVKENEILIDQAMRNNNTLNQLTHREGIYFFAVDDNMFKVGRTTDIIRRLRNYNVGRISDVELKYFAIVKNATKIEQCIKILLGKHKYNQRREIYKINEIDLVKAINTCYKLHVSQSQCAETCEMIDNLLGLYNMCQSSKNIVPYVIIGLNIVDL